MVMFKTYVTYAIHTQLNNRRKPSHSKEHRSCDLPIYPVAQLTLLKSISK